MQPAKSTKYLCLFLCGICSDYTLRNQGLCGLVWLDLFGGETIPQKQRGRLCCHPLPLRCESFQALPNRKAASPSRFLVRKFLAVTNSSPTSPNRISHVRMANFGFSVCCGFGLAVRSPFAISERARQSCM